MASSHHEKSKKEILIDLISSLKREEEATVEVAANQAEKTQESQLTHSSVVGLPGVMLKQWSVGQELDVCTPANKKATLFLPLNTMSAQQKTAKFYEESPAIRTPDHSSICKIQINESGDQGSPLSMRVKPDVPTSKEKKAQDSAASKSDQTDFLKFLEHTHIEGTSSAHKKDKHDKDAVLSQDSKDITDYNGLSKVLRPSLQETMNILAK